MRPLSASYRRGAGFAGLGLLFLVASFIALDWSGPWWGEGSRRGYKYDGRGRVVERVEGPHLARFSYDGLGRLAKVACFKRGAVTGWAYPSSGGARFEYDAAGNRLAVVDALGRTEYEYDKLSRPAARTTAEGVKLAYEVDPWGRVTRTGLWGGVAVEYEYDLQDRVVRARAGGIEVRYEYAADGRSLTRRLGNGIVTRIEGDEGGHIVAIAHQDPRGALIAGFRYRHDADGRIDLVEETTPAGSATTQYAYDPVGRLARVVLPGGGTQAYEYDGLGNRKAEIGPGGRTEYVHDGEGRLLQAGDVKLDYDAAGNVTSKRVGQRWARYRYDSENRLVEVRSDRGSVRYAYDGEGHRARREFEGKTTSYVHDVAGPLSQVTAAFQDGVLGAQYVFGASRVARIDAGGQVRYLLEDRLGSTRAVVDAAGRVVARYTYSPFGAPERVEGDEAESFLFGGEPYDPETGLVHMRAREYDPELGRFLSPDPVTGTPAEPRTFNRYVFALADPINNTDPTGLTANWAPPPPPPPPFDSDPDRLLWELRRTGGSWHAIRPPAEPPAANHTRSTLASWFPSKDNVVGLRSWHDYSIMAYPWRQGGHISTMLYHAVPPINSIARVHDAWMERIEQPSGRLGFVAANVPMMLPAAAYGTFQYLGGKTVPVGDFLLRTETALRALAPDVVSAISPWRDSRNVFLPPPGGGAGSFPLVGGVYLDQVARVLGDLGAIRGARYDARTGQLVLVGDRQTSLPPMKPEYLATAIRAVYAGGPHEPGMTIDPFPQNPRAPNMLVRFFGNTEESRLGWVMFEADRLMKGYSVGTDNITKRPVQSAVPGYQSVTRMTLAAGGKVPDLWSRFWLVPEPIVGQVSDGGETIAFPPVRMRVKTETMRWAGGKLVPAGGVKDPHAEAFAEHLTRNYDAFARESPVFAELRQVTQAVALAKWLKEQGVPADWNFVRVFDRPFDTPETTPAAYNELRDPILDAGGRQIGTRLVSSFGGVEMAPKLVLERSAAAASLGSELARGLDEARKSGQPSFTVEVAGKPHLAVALPGPNQREAASYTLVETDLPGLLPAMDGFPGLTRTYDSLHNEPSELGRAWSLLLPRLAFEAAGKKGRLEYVSVGGIPGTQVLLQRFTLTNAFGLGQARFAEHYIDQGLRRIGFRPEEPGPYRGLFPESDGAYRLFFESGDQAIFDSAGRLRFLFASGGKAVYAYDGAARLTAMRVERAGARRELKLAYDAKGRISGMTAGSERVAYQYDEAGNLREARTGSRAVSYSYSPMGLLAGVAWDGLTVVENTYDAAGRLLGQRDFRGREIEQKVEMTADGGRRVTVRDGADMVTQVFDRDLRPLEEASPDGARIEYSYGEKGRLERVETTLPNGAHNRVELSAAGQVAVITDPRGIRTEYRYYDGGGSLAEVLIDGQRVAAYSYGGQARLVRADYAGGEREEYEYDGQDHLRLYRRVQSGVSREIAVPAERALPGETAGARSSVGTAAGPRIERTQDGSVVHRSASGTETRYAFDATGLLTTVRDAAGVSTSFEYDRKRRLSQVRPAGGPCIRYEYDAEGRISAEIRGTCAVHP